MGRQVAILFDGIKPAGYHNISWDGTNQLGDHVSSGMYVYSIHTDNYISSKKMIFIK